MRENSKMTVREEHQLVSLLHKLLLEEELMASTRQAVETVLERFDVADSSFVALFNEVLKQRAKHA